MVLKRLFGRKAARHFRLRIENCISTILDVNERLGEGKIKPEILDQFSRLKESIQYLSDDNVDEENIHRIEEATNQLLAEIRGSCESKLEGLLSGDSVH